MKKFIVFSICAIGSMAAFAQTSLVKEAERKIKANPQDYPAVLETLKPAFTNAETENDAYPYFVAGKGGYDYYDQLDGYKTIGKQVDDSRMGRALIDSYSYLSEAIVKDSLPDEKGKIKPKYSKEILKLVKNHYKDYDQAARYMWGAGDYAGSYDAWEIFVKAPNDPVFSQAGLVALPDSTIGEIYYNQALAAWQAQQLEKAIASFDKALELGYNKKQLFDYAIAVAYGLHDNDLITKYAEMAYPLYGKEDTNFVSYVINAKINNNQYDEAQQIINDLIAETPDKAQLYYVRSVLYENLDKLDEAFADIEKAYQLNPEDAQVLMSYGRQIYNKAIKMNEDYNNLSTAEYNKVRKEKVNPMFKKAAEYLEKAYSLDMDNNHKALTLLRACYYNIEDEANLKRIEAEM